MANDRDVLQKYMDAVKQFVVTPANPVGGGLGNAGANKQTGAAQQQQQSQQAASSWVFTTSPTPVTLNAQRRWEPCTCVLTLSSPKCACCARPMREQADSAMHFGMSDATLDHWHLSCLLDQLMRAPTATISAAMSATAWHDHAGACPGCAFTSPLRAFRDYALTNGLP